MYKSKICTDCQIDKTLDKFHANKKGVYGLHNKCKDCRNKSIRQKNYLPLTSGFKLCPKCNIQLDVSEFNKDKTNKSGLQTYCKSCSTNNVKSWTSSFDGYVNKIYLDLINNQKKSLNPIQVNISINDIKEQYYKQNGKCSLSGIRMTMDTYMSKDHHIINKNNMVIDRINNNLGYEKDNIQLVINIAHKMKNDMNNDDFIKLCSIINEYNIN